MTLVIMLDGHIVLENERHLSFRVLVVFCEISVWLVLLDCFYLGATRLAQMIVLAIVAAVEKVTVQQTEWSFARTMKILLKASLVEILSDRIIIRGEDE